jgi:hypothetical protein
MKGFDQQRAIEFALDLEDNEGRMGEMAAAAVTCENYGIESWEYVEVLIMLPDGPWWLLDTRLTDAEREALILRDKTRMEPCPLIQAGNLDQGAPNHTDHSKRGFTPK